MAKGKMHLTEEEIAFHEAGHAVVARDLRRGIRAVTIVSDETFEGCVSFRPRRSFQPEINCDASTRRRVEEEIMITWGGHLAQEKYRGKPTQMVSSSDIQNLGIASYMVGSNEEEEAYIEWLRIKTTNILNQPDNWAAVEALAAELLKRKTLSGAAACRVIDTAIDEFWVTVLAKPAGLQD